MSIFDQLKRSSSAVQDVTTTKTSQKIYFKLLFNEAGAYIEVVDRSGEVVEFDYHQFSGMMRSITKNISLAQERNDFTIDWENPENELYLHEHPYLISPLLESGKLVGARQEEIGTLEGVAEINLQLKEREKDVVSAHLQLLTAEDRFDDFRFLNEEHAYIRRSKKVTETRPVGMLFSTISAFNEPALAVSDLQKYLSLFFSYVDNATVQYKEYDVKRIREPLRARPTLIFEKVDADNSLYMRVSQMMPNTDTDFLENYDLFRFATINEMEESITVQPIEQLPVESLIKDVEKRLYKHSKKRKSQTGILREDNLLIVPEEIASAFIYKEIPSLITDYALVGSDKLKDYKINVQAPRLNVQLGHGIDFLEGDASLDFGEQNISLTEALSQFKKNHYILLSDGSHALVNEDYMKKLQRLFKKKKGKKGKVEVSFFDLPLVEELIEEKTQQEFGKAREVFEGFNKLAKKQSKLPAVEARLRPYQKQGYKWLQYLYKQNLGGCLADDMGLGKTLQAITLLTKIYKKKKTQKPSLLIMPRSLLFNWENELKKFSPQLSFYTWYGNNRDMKEAEQKNLILTTYGMVRNNIEEFKEKEFLYVILDESQAAKNINSRIHKAIMLLQSKHRLALSGTPVENNLSELYALFRFLNPSMFGTADNFNKNYLRPIQKEDDKEATEELRRKIYPFILRRLKGEVLKDLPQKTEQTLFVEMSDEQARFYEQRRRFYKEAIDQQVAMKGIHQAQFFIFQAFNELRQIASVPESPSDQKIHSTKIEVLLDQMADAIANRHKVLVFANYLAAVEMIGEALDERGIDFVTMTGSTRNRQQLVKRFQNDGDCKAFILTLKTGGTGLNLTAADTIFIFDPWWNKAAENQAVDRAHRIGQDKKVMSYKLITMNTIEEKMLKLQEMKSELFENIISSDSASLKSLSENDIEFMLEK